MAITIDETGIKIDGVLKVDINTAVQLANKANINGDANQTFKVADAINNDEAINKEQLLTEIGNIDLSSKADLNGNSSQTFKVADAINNDEAINKGQLLTEIQAVGGTGSGLDADTVDGVQGALLGIGGEGYTWVDEEANRALGTTYTNTTGRPILVSVVISSSTENQFHYSYVDDVRVNTTRTPDVTNGSHYHATHVLLVPNNSTYKVTGGSISVWKELK